MVNANRRSQYWVNPPFQRRFLRTILLLELKVLAAVACLAGLGWFFYFMSGQFAFNSLAYVAAFIVIAGAAIGGIILVTVRTSAKICGPVYRMLDMMREVSQGGHCAPLKIRAEDYFEELEEGFNDMLDYIEKAKSRETFEESDSTPAAHGVFQA